MIHINRSIELRTIQTPQFIFSGRDEDVQDLTLLMNMVTGITQWGDSGVKFLPHELNLLKKVLIEKSNELISRLENADKLNNFATE